ncbi:HTH domain-containing protein [Natrinema halophilum]|uniref:Uncharacterized protein n=1 Tax=Natrinema halophilum TaxID=1699371 RepID=A0A7D5KJ67_9EURY|nr:HTH domain-containing protein [Natrinema halophilum]QLG49199.1 hypothetical protein HYG82_10185 [Natrinema halophilum]
MSASEPAVHPVVDPDHREYVRIDCYVRSNVPAAVSDQIRALVDRLWSLREHGCIDDVQVSRWPPQRLLTTEAGSTRGDLVTEFEQWANRHGYSLEPGFRRRENPPAPFVVDTERREQIRVPLVALAFYEDDDADALRGVVPCTERSATGDERTYTVDGWLTAAETRAFDEPIRASQTDQPPLMERQ